MCIRDREINIATQREISIGDLAKEIIAQINPDAKIVCDEQRLSPEKSEAVSYTHLDVYKRQQ